jgi:tetratricopeptide (TPR) repeat protein
VALGELDCAQSPPSATPTPAFALDEKLLEWETNRTVAFAAEVVTTAMSSGESERAHEAARFILSNDAVLPAVRRLARKVLGEGGGEAVEEEQINSRIRTLRGTVRKDSRNAIRWVDLALEYVSLGLKDKSSSAMRIAVSLAPDNRFVLRSAARLFVHLGEPDHAHYLLLQTKRIDYDPWLMAAEIAVSEVAQRDSESLKIGRRILSSSSLPPLHTSELASAVATREMANGNARNARKLFRQSLIQPTSNSVGQVRWAEKALGIELDDVSLRVDRAFEARAWKFHYEGQWGDALSESLKWFSDEPYSSRPAMLGSYIAAVVLHDYEEATRIAQRGLAANPSEPGLLNNLIFALACDGKLSEAVKLVPKLSQITRDDAGRIILLATCGLIEYRQGNPAQGRELYMQAIRKADLPNFRLLRARAAVHLALEEARARTAEADGAAALALECARNISDLDLQLQLEGLRSR